MTGGWFKDDDEEAQCHREYEAAPRHKAELSHELLGGAAAFYAAHKYQEHVANEGKPVSHALAKELIAGFAGTFIEGAVESKGLDYIDKKKAQHDAVRKATKAKNAPAEFQVDEQFTEVVTDN